MYLCRVKKIAKILVISLLVLLMWSLVDVPDMMAQCPMCRMSAESNLQNGGTNGKGLNAGILFMLSLPYLIVGSIGYIWWKNQKASTADTPV